LPAAMAALPVPVCRVRGAGVRLSSGPVTAADQAAAAASRRTLEFLNGCVDERRATFISVREIQDRRQQSAAWKRFGEEVGFRLRDRTEVRFPAVVRMGHAHDVRDEDQFDAPSGQIQHGAVRNLRGKTETGIGCEIASRVHVREEDLHAQACEKKVE
jgi:hypothetical protein